MGQQNVMLECLARYSKSNLALMIFDNLEKLPRAIWQIAGRTRQLVLVADDGNLAEVLRAAKKSAYDAIHYRLVENLSEKNREILNKALIKMESGQKGKFIFTTNDFDTFDLEFLRLVCRIKYHINLDDEPVKRGNDRLQQRNVRRGRNYDENNPDEE